MRERIEKIGRIAEQTATSMSRRQFIGRLGGGATALAGLLAGVVGVPGLARAASTARCCFYSCYDISPGRVERYHARTCVADGSPCPSQTGGGRGGGCFLKSEHLVRDCDRC